MSTDWKAKQSSIYATLKNAGTMFVFRRIGKTLPDPITGEIADKFDLTFTAPGIMRFSSGVPSKQWMYMAPGASAFAQAASGMIQKGEEALLIGAGTYDPVEEDRVAIDGVEWVVKGHSTLRPAIVPLLHVLTIRKG